MKLVPGVISQRNGPTRHPEYVQVAKHRRRKREQNTGHPDDKRPIERAPWGRVAGQDKLRLLNRDSIAGAQVRPKWNVNFRDDGRKQWRNEQKPESRKENSMPVGR